MFEKIIKQIVSVLRHKKINVVLIGGYASNLYGEVRLTKDIDFLLGVGLEGVEDALSIIPKANLKPISPTPLQSALRDHYLRCIYGDNQMIVDILFGSSEYERAIFERAKTITIDRTKVLVATMEDVIIMKAQANRARDWDDIRGILLRNPECDNKYIVRWLMTIDGEQETDYLMKFRELVKSLD